MVLAKSSAARFLLRKQAQISMKIYSVMPWRRPNLGRPQGIVLLIFLSLPVAAQSRKSGFDFMQPATKAMQRDDAQNPAMLWVADGETLWNQQEGTANKSCANCHGAAKQSMQGVAARYPAFSAITNKPINLQQRINLCRTTKQKADALALEHQNLLNLETYISLQSRGQKIVQSVSHKLNTARKQGASLFNTRMGQLDLSCADCHQTYAGYRLGGNVIPQAHPTGYPLYRLEWQAVGSLQRRIRNCMTGVRAEPFAYGSDEMLALEVYLSHRARGMIFEAPAVRP